MGECVRHKMRLAVPANAVSGDSQRQVQFTVNGRAASVDVPPNTLLVHALREHLLLTGTHVGCDTSQCGACTVHVNGRAVKSCSMLAVQAQGADVQTIEGLAAPDGTMHPWSCLLGLLCEWAGAQADAMAFWPTCTARTMFW